MPAVGSVTVTTLLAHCPSSALLAGARLPPWWGRTVQSRDSGKMRGTRAIWGGSSVVLSIPLPQHQLGKGLLRSLIADSGLNIAEFVKFL